ncbi:MAG: P-loop NTPase [Rickettsiales bacterium]|jgi:ATP-binding protein involved in chromosome partitioning|nr:P-loop NTPase [Rickettsiales bacterium]
MTMQTKSSESIDIRIARLGQIIAVASGKGGVGKSTVSTNLALALAAKGAAVGLVDADLYGPSVPGMLGIETGKAPAMSPSGQVIPAQAHGIKVISMGMLTDDDKPAILRGPMVSKYLRMFILEVDWGKLDYLILDLPPGTGDTQLTLAQSFPLTGAVVVSTPQDVSLKIARRGIRMMEQVKVPILGIIENMSGFTCPSCHEITHIFHQGGGAKIAGSIGVPFLGAIPLDPMIVDCGDEGSPLVTAHPDAPASAVYRDIAETLSRRAHAVSGIPTPFDWHWANDTSKPKASDHPANVNGMADVLVALDRRDDRTLLLHWQDGYDQQIDMRDLRLSCRCAACVDEMSGRPTLDPTTVPLNIVPTRIWSLGNYAIGVSFSDGHQSGIYTFIYLRGMLDAEVEDV